MSLLINNKLTFLIFLIFTDQLSKLFIAKNLNLGQSLSLFPFVDITLVFNTGVAFSLFSSYGNSLFSWVLVVFAFLVGFASITFLWKTQQIRLQLAFSLLAAGALGNAIDRARFGFVVDFLDFHWQQWHFAIFNFADTWISCAVVFFLFHEYRTYRERLKSKIY